jgi:esterase/lipase superfamily enzyme
MRREYHAWDSRHLGRKMELLEFGERGKPVLVFPTSSGRFFDYENFGMIGALADKIEAGELHLFCVDSVDAESFYARWKRPADRIVRHMEYQHYLVEEMIPFLLGRSERTDLAVTGNSFGGYHVVNFALRRPDLVDKAVSLGGAYDMESFFDGYYDDNVFYNSPFDFLPGLTDPWHLQRYNSTCLIILGTGETDMCRGSNERLSQLLSGKGIRHVLDVHAGMGHDWTFWRQMARWYLP